MLALAILLSIFNRCSSKRRSTNLKKSIFTLPVYVYPSREKKAAAVREARARLHGECVRLVPTVGSVGIAPSADQFIFFSHVRSEETRQVSVDRGGPSR